MNIQVYNIVMIDENIDFCMTLDGSTGLFNKAVNDIYHSSYGAKTEAVEKFVRPLNLRQNFAQNKNIKVLDICYGIGYNTKAFLDEIINLKINSKIQIDILEHDRRLVLLSPFIRDNIKNDIISYILLSAISGYMDGEEAIFRIMTSPENKKFFKPSTRLFNKRFISYPYTYSPLYNKPAFLHNIYYHYVSKRSKNSLKYLKNGAFKIKPYFQDARKSILELSGGYDIVFLDAFTPVKLPTLWSLDFFVRLYELMKEKSMLVTYSNSAAVRHAMMTAGFCTGKLFDRRNRPCGTIACKSGELIEHKLDEYDLGRMQTNAGVYFRDKNLNSTAEEILSEWEERKCSLNLPSSSSFIKKYKKQKEESCSI